MRRICWLFTIFILFIGCGPEAVEFTSSKNLNKELQVKKVGVFSLTKGDSLSDILIGRVRTGRGGFAKHPNRNIFAFYDEIYNRFLITRHDTIYTTIGSKGRGPKEFLGVNSFTFNSKGNLVVYDSAQRMVKVFSVQGELLHTFTIGSSSHYSIAASFIYPIKSTYYFGIVETKYLNNLEDIWKSPLIGKYDRDGKFKGIFGKYDPYIKKARHYNVFPVIDIDPVENQLVTTHRTSYRIQLFDLEKEKRVAYFGLKSKNYKKSGEVVDPFMPRIKIARLSVDKSKTRGVYFTDHYIILGFQNVTMKWYKSHNLKANSFYLVIYNRKTKAFVDEVKVPLPLINIVDNKIYLLKTDNPANYTLNVYELEK